MKVIKLYYNNLGKPEVPGSALVVKADLRWWNVYYPPLGKDSKSIAIQELYKDNNTFGYFLVKKEDFEEIDGVPLLEFINKKNINQYQHWFVSGHITKINKEGQLIKRIIKDRILSFPKGPPSKELPTKVKPWYINNLVITEAVPSVSSLCGSISIQDLLRAKKEQDIVNKKEDKKYMKKRIKPEFWIFCGIVVLSLIGVIFGVITTL